jgi:small neutral amino acid transporter SnatA (MarC family)
MVLSKIKGDKMNQTGMILASRWKRLGGAILDGLISMAILIPLMLVTGIFQRSFGEEGMTMGQRVKRQVSNL